MDVRILWCHLTINMLLLLQVASAQTRTLLQSLMGEVGAGNYSYYKLTKKGPIQLVVKSLEGDADLYVSQSTAQPTYEDYDLKSATYGYDIVDIPSSTKRPVGIGVYGHPFSERSRYQLDIYWVLTDEFGNDFKSSLPSFNEEPEEESLLWTIAINILKILFEVLF